MSERERERERPLGSCKGWMSKEYKCWEDLGHVSSPPTVLIKHTLSLSPPPLLSSPLLPPQRLTPSLSSHTLSLSLSLSLSPHSIFSFLLLELCCCDNTTHKNVILNSWLKALATHFPLSLSLSLSLSLYFACIFEAFVLFVFSTDGGPIRTLNVGCIHFPYHSRPSLFFLICFPRDGWYVSRVF